MRQDALLLLAIALIALLPMASAQAYWFQSGAATGSVAEFNNGSSVAIETVAQNNITSGSPAFWVGETLNNGAFVQFGYMIAPVTESYPSLCTTSLGCTSYEDINAGQAEWFYEYFPINYYRSNFFGGVGPSGSAGAQGTFNNYSFRSAGTTWNFLFNGKVVGSVDLGAASSGPNSPVAFLELANATNATSVISPVIMSNLSYYSGSSLIQAPSAHSYVGYGVGSAQGVQNPYGVQEIDGRVNYFKVGSGIPLLANGTQLWSLGYYLTIKSQYAGIASRQEDTAYSKIALQAPRIFYLNSTARAVFAGWQGSGVGSYSGFLNSTTIEMNSNITETAVWQLQYFVNVSSQHGITAGSGWYDSGSQFNYSISNATVYQNLTSRYIFEGWSNGASVQSARAYATSPLKISAEMQHQYLINATAQYGHVIGGGWKEANSTATLSLSGLYAEQNASSRMAFYSWSNGEKKPTFTIAANKSYSLTAIFRKEYFNVFQAVDSYGNRIDAGRFYVNGTVFNSTSFLFAGEKYNITEAYYKGVWMPIEKRITVNSSSVAEITLPVYNVEITATDIFGKPVNATGTVRFTNGTIANVETGSSASAVFYDVPYGVAKGSLSYFIVSAGINAEGGAPVRLIFITPLDLSAFIAVIILASAFYAFVRHRLSNKADLGKP